MDPERKKFTKYYSYKRKKERMKIKKQFTRTMVSY